MGSQLEKSSERGVVIEVTWVPTDPHGALPGHHWQKTVTVNGHVERQSRYFKQHLALEDAANWLAHRLEVEQEIDIMRTRAGVQT